MAEIGHVRRDQKFKIQNVKFEIEVLNTSAFSPLFPVGLQLRTQHFSLISSGQLIPHFSFRIPQNLTLSSAPNSEPRTQNFFTHPARHLSRSVAGSREFSREDTTGTVK